MRERIFVITVLFAVLAACQPKAIHKDDITLGLTKIISTSINDSVTFCISDLFESDCDSIMFISPYTHLDRLSKRTDIDFTVLINTGIEIRDDIHLLAILSKGRLVDYYLIYHLRVRVGELEPLSFHSSDKPLLLINIDEYLLLTY